MLGIKDTEVNKSHICLLGNHSLVETLSIQF